MKLHHSSFILRGCVSAILLSGLLSFSHAADKGITVGTPPPPVSEMTMFSFDDVSIPWKHNLKLTLVPAQKHPDNPVLRCGPEGAPDHGHAVLYGTVLKDGEKFRMWYLGMIESEIVHGQAPGWWRPMCYAESPDGIHWTKPDLGLVELKGSKHNNICLIEGDPDSLTRVNDFLSVLHDPSDPDPSRRYKAAYIAHVPYDDIKGGMSKIGIKERRVGATICVTSPDGIHWKVVGDRPANAGGERFEVSSLYQFGGFYYTTGQLISPWSWRADGSKADRMMWAYRSPDFVHWRQDKALSFARPGQLAEPPVAGQQTHMGAGLWNRGNVLMGFYGMWQNAAEPPPKGASHLTGVHVDLGLVMSNDGIHFREPVPGFKMIARGQENEWDHVALLQGHAFVNVGDQTMVWYSHWNTGGKLENMEIGLATFRRDGFGYLSRMSEESDAEFITTSFTANHGGKLLLNVDEATTDAPLTVELLDHDLPVPGYSGNDAAQIATNGTQQVVTWPKTKSSALPANKPLEVRIHWPEQSHAKVFALYVTE